MIEKLKALDDLTLDRQETTELEDALIELKQELIALWEVDMLWLKNHRKNDPALIADLHRARKDALKALNAKAAEVLK